jgi:hypothetical protein
MDEQTFAAHFRQAHALAITFTRQRVLQNLPDQRMFLLHPNQSYDGHPLVDDEQIYPEDSLPSDKYLGPLTEEQVLAFLWRSGKVPEWINVMVEAQDDNFTYIELLCCGRYTANDENLYHRHEGYPPFHVLSPNLPAGWKSIEESNKFDLYWNRREGT